MFDGNIATFFHTTDDASKNQWAQIDFGAEVQVKKSNFSTNEFMCSEKTISHL